MKHGLLLLSSCNIHGLRQRVLKLSNDLDEVTKFFTSDTFQPATLNILFLPKSPCHRCYLFTHLRTKLCAFSAFARINIMCTSLSHSHCRVSPQTVITLEICTWSLNIAAPLRLCVIFGRTCAFRVDQCLGGGASGSSELRFLFRSAGPAFLAGPQPRGFS